MTYVVTDHAYKRCKERLGWNKATVNRMVERCYHLGWAPSDVKGSLHRYIMSVILKDDNKVNRVRIYGEYVFLFENTILVTALELPHRFKHLIPKHG